jgi:hypothetical protein
VVNYKGLLTSWGEPVDAYYMFRANYAPAQSEPMVYIHSHTWPDRFDAPGVKSNLVVYSNCDEVELFNDLGASSLGVKKHGPRGTHFEWDEVPIQYNVLYAEGRIGGETVAQDIIVLDNLPPAPRFEKSQQADNDNTAPAPGAKYLYRINCGGDRYTDTHGNTWEADSHWHSWAEEYDNLDPRYASTGATHDPITGTRDDALLQTYRYGRDKLRYRFEVPNGRYVVELYFIEPWYGTGGGMDCTAWRLFDVAINGNVVLDDLDLWKQAGQDTALRREIPVTVTNGVLEIDFPEVKSYQAVISAVAVRQVDSEAGAGKHPSPKEADPGPERKTYSSPNAVYDAYCLAVRTEDWRTLYFLHTPEAQRDMVFEAVFVCLMHDSEKPHPLISVQEEYGASEAAFGKRYYEGYKKKHGHAELIDRYLAKAIPHWESNDKGAGGSETAQNDTTEPPPEFAAVSALPKDDELTRQALFDATKDKVRFFAEVQKIVSEGRKPTVFGQLEHIIIKGDTATGQARLTFSPSPGSMKQDVTESDRTIKFRRINGSWLMDGP